MKPTTHWKLIDKVDLKQDHETLSEILYILAECPESIPDSFPASEYDVTDYLELRQFYSGEPVWMVAPDWATTKSVNSRIQPGNYDRDTMITQYNSHHTADTAPADFKFMWRGGDATQEDRSDLS